MDDYTRDLIDTARRITSRHIIMGEINPEQLCRRLADALEYATTELDILRRGGSKTDVINAHVALLEDRGLLPRIQKSQ